LYLFDRIHTQC